MESSIIQGSAALNSGLHTGARAAMVVVFSSEITQMITDSRWIFIAIIFFCILDFRLGCKESAMRKAEADKEHNKLLSEVYRFHRSRAIRRSASKFIDYTILMLVAESFGAAFLPSCGIDYIWGAWAGGLIACGCELSSACGHFLFIHGIKVEKKSVKGYVVAFLKAVAVAVAKQKAGEEMGEAVGNAFDEMNKKK